MTPSRRKGKRFERDVEMTKLLMVVDVALADLARRGAKRKGGGE